MTQIWQKEDCGTDSATLKRILTEFRSDGAQGIESNKQLTEYIERLSDEKLLEMYTMDDDATLQILVDCLGAKKAFAAAVKAAHMQEEGKAKYYKDKMLDALQTERKLAEEAKRLEYEIVTLKAKLYDAYEEKITKPTEKQEIKGECSEWKVGKEKTLSGSSE